MKYTQLQKKVMDELKYCKVRYRKMWVKNHSLGYCSKGLSKYEINIASDFPSRECKDITLIHEAGHIYYGHTDSVNLEEEFTTIRNMAKSMGISLDDIRYNYGGLHDFVNIAMDCLINSTILTRGNVKTMEINGLKLCTPSAYEIEVMDDFRDYYKPLIERIKNNPSPYQMEESMRDLVSRVSAFSDGIDDEIRKEVSKEKYEDGDSKAKEDNVVETSDLGKESKRIENPGMNESSHITSMEEELVGHTEGVYKFIKKLVFHSFSRKNDILRHYIRGTRKNSEGILYSSFRRRNSMEKRKMAILADVSGSMPTKELISALSTLKDSMNILTSDSVLVTWDTALINEYSIRNIPDSLKLGGGTDMSKGVKYLSEKGFTDIVIYSDMETNMDTLIKECKESRAHIYSIIVGNEFNRYPKFKDFLKLNKDYTFVKSSES